jgi:hypothetical protein
LYTIYKIDPKLINDLNKRAKTIKLLEKKMANLQTLDLAMDF